MIPTKVAMTTLNNIYSPQLPSDRVLKTSFMKKIQIQTFVEKTLKRLFCTVIGNPDKKDSIIELR